MKRRWLLIASLAAAAYAAVVATVRADAVAPTHEQAQGKVIVDLVGVASSKGQMLAAMFRDRRGFPEKGGTAYRKVVAKAHAGTMRLEFDNVPAGPYAISVHHDEDADFHFDTGLFGIPTEGYGFSRNAHAPFGPPDFDLCVLKMAAGKIHHLQIRLRY